MFPHPPSSRSPSATPAPLPGALQPELHEGGLAADPSESRYRTKVIREDVERRENARMGAIMPGTGDGSALGEECFLWTDVPNVKNFRYIPCALSATPSPHPSVPFYRTIPYPPPVPLVHLSLLDRSNYLRISPSLLTVCNERGFRSCRANVSVREGAWYYEVKIEIGDGDRGAGRGLGGDSVVGNPHVRLGWGRRESNLDTPVGCDAYSYGIRDATGEKVHLSRPKTYARKGFRSGDVVGCLIKLPPRPSLEGKPTYHPAHVKRQRRAFNYKSQAYFESAEYAPCREMEALVDRDGKLAAAAANGNGESNGDVANHKKTAGAATKHTKKSKKPSEKQAPSPEEPASRKLERLSESSISFFINGEPFGAAFEDIFDFTPLPPLRAPGTGKKQYGDDVMHDDGTLGYYPMVSCFGRAKVKANFGPDFAHPLPVLPDGTPVKAMSDRWPDFRKEEAAQDDVDEVEDTKRLEAILEAEKKALQKKMAKSKAKGGKSGSATPKGGVPAGTKKAQASQQKRKRAGTEASTPGPDSVRGRTQTPVTAPSSVRGRTMTPVLFAQSDIADIPGEWDQEGQESTRERSISVAQSDASSRDPWGRSRDEVEQEEQAERERDIKRPRPEEHMLSAGNSEDGYGEEEEEEEGEEEEVEDREKRETNEEERGEEGEEDEEEEEGIKW
ncbi:hypothetical protein B9479_003618 [Cryptococcus floricola]|uniref:SPRY domain-containing protein n=1 Tax=Cryptococcus floricola TaxID=2591691 RepID=A0A5D3AZL2_9TREE|nr:hypothetical protein B9479_003618 [Cryptococcus floricola]